MTELEWRSKFSQKIISKMNILGLSQKELSELSHISEGTLSKYISGRMTPKADAIVNLAKVLQCSVTELIQFGEMIFKGEK